MPAKYILPDCLRDQRVDEAAFVRWLHRKAQAHVRRDKKRQIAGVSVAGFKEAIYRAVVEAGGCDYYTGQPLDWHRISQWDNAEAAAKRGEYKKTFWNLPTVDHDFSDNGSAVFRLCSWRVNDAKNDQTIEEFLELAKAIRIHRELA